MVASPFTSSGPSATPEPQAAVAVVRIPGPDPEYLLLKRAANPLDPWSGHLAFPGGRREPNDADLLATCIREAREECGLVLEPSHFRAALTPASAGRHAVHKTLVAPFLFELPSKPTLRLDPEEMDAFYWLPVSYLNNPAHHGQGELSLDSPRRLFPFIRVGPGPEHGHIWGFTYGVLSALLREPEMDP